MGGLRRAVGGALQAIGVLLVLALAALLLVGGILAAPLVAAAAVGAVLAVGLAHRARARRRGSDSGQGSSAALVAWALLALYVIGLIAFAVGAIGSAAGVTPGG